MHRALDASALHFGPAHAKPRYLGMRVVPCGTPCGKGRERCAFRPRRRSSALYASIEAEDEDDYDPDLDDADLDAELAEGNGGGGYGGEKKKVGRCAGLRAWTWPCLHRQGHEGWCRHCAAGVPAQRLRRMHLQALKAVV